MKTVEDNCDPTTADRFERQAEGSPKDVLLLPSPCFMMLTSKPVHEAHAMSKNETLTAIPW